MTWKTEWLKSLPQDRIKKKGVKRNEDSLRDLWDNIKCANICVIGVPEGEKREKRTKSTTEEIIAENFPNMGNEPVIQVQEAQRVPYRINPRRNMPRHIFIKLTQIKQKEKNIKSSKGKTTSNI